MLILQPVQLPLQSLRSSRPQAAAFIPNTHAHTVLPRATRRGGGPGGQTAVKRRDLRRKTSPSPLTLGDPTRKSWSSGCPSSPPVTPRPPQANRPHCHLPLLSPCVLAPAEPRSPAGAAARARLRRCRWRRRPRGPPGRRRHAPGEDERPPSTSSAARRRVLLGGAERGGSCRKRGGCCRYGGGRRRWRRRSSSSSATRRAPSKMTSTTAAMWPRPASISAWVGTVVTAVRPFPRVLSASPVRAGGPLLPPLVGRQRGFEPQCPQQCPLLTPHRLWRLPELELLRPR